MENLNVTNRFSVNQNIEKMVRQNDIPEHGNCQRNPII